ncbi:MAG: protein phosphatase 2C domain-containing protein [Clostridia bacterium]|nr:protein phosphatase 2C domain-containing protein [Clostridia bacterium]
MIAQYYFSLQGKRHIKKNQPCQDYSLIREITPAWKIAAVSDGVSRSAHSEIASRIACETACEFVEKAIPFDSGSNSFLEEDASALIRCAMHAAQNAVEAYADEKDDSYNNYDATLVLVLYNGYTAYVGYVGDSGVALLLDDGELIFSQPMNDENGHVYPLRLRTNYAFSKMENVAAVLCSTDGIYKDCFMDMGQYDKSKVDLFIPYELFSDNMEDEYNTVIENLKKKLISSLEAINRETDDMSAALLINTSKTVEKPERPQKPLIETLMAKANHYKDEEIREKVFRFQLRLVHPQLTDEQIKDIYTGKKDLESVLSEISNENNDPAPSDKEQNGEEAKSPEKVPEETPEEVSEETPEENPEKTAEDTPDETANQDPEDDTQKDQTPPSPDNGENANDKKSIGEKIKEKFLSLTVDKKGE